MLCDVRMVLIKSALCLFHPVLLYETNEESMIDGVLVAIIVNGGE